jgi:retron-type reverse transcriptase
MTADPSAGAVSHLSTDWHSINWKAANEIVRRLQARIVKATKEGKWHKVHALQHLLTHSISGGIHLSRDSWVSVMYPEGLHSPKSSGTHERTDRHQGIVGQERCHYPRDL